jgi:hypothetical protein
MGRVDVDTSVGWDISSETAAPNFIRSAALAWGAFMVALLVTDHYIHAHLRIVTTQ